jgi:hypothetical protein
MFFSGTVLAEGSAAGRPPSLPHDGGMAPNIMHKTCPEVKQGGVQAAHFRWDFDSAQSGALSLGAGLWPYWLGVLAGFTGRVVLGQGQEPSYAPPLINIPCAQSMAGA